jgi:NMD protein affecting ribosome stability and mRNA decay
MSKQERGPPRAQPKGGRRARMVQPHEHDPYRRRAKAPEVQRCPDCGAFCHAGRWSWDPPTGAELYSLRCPACTRILDRYPAGTIRLHGELGALRDELLALIESLERQEKAEHPLERLMEIADGEDGLVVTTTGIHMARCIAGALRRRFHGKVTIRYPPEEALIYVDWSP